MTGEDMCPLTPELLLANHKRKEVENWRNLKRSEAKARMAEISRLEGEIATEMAEIEELMVSPKAWTRKGQTEIAQQRRGTLAKEGEKKEMLAQLALIKKDAEMDVKKVLEKMWETADEEEKQQFIDEFEALQEKYIEPRLGQRVRLTRLQVKHMRGAGHKDISMAPGACDAMKSTKTRWFGNMTFDNGNFPDIKAGTLAKDGGIGTIKVVHKAGDRVMVNWDRTGKSEWYPTGHLCKFSLALCDQDEGRGTTGFGEGITTLRLFTSRIDMPPREAAERVELRRRKHLGRGEEMPDYGVEGEKHIGREYDRLTGTGYL